jgi:hypothetical protein
MQEVHLSRPAIRLVLLIVRPRVEALEHINIQNIQLQQPLPQCSMVHAVKCICEVQVTEEGITQFCCVLDGPEQALHLPLRGLQLEELLPCLSASK